MASPYSYARFRAVRCLVTCGLIFVSQAHLGLAEDRPNILFVFADDWGRYASAYGAVEPDA